MKLILTGGAGLVGQNFLAQAQLHNFNDIVVIDKHKCNLDVVKKFFPHVIAVEADLSERGDWCSHFKDAAIVIMLQAQIGGTDKLKFKNNTIKSTENVISIMKHYEIQRLIHISSSVVTSKVYDDYVDSKRVQEELVLNSGLDVTVFRPTLMFGWFDRKHLGWLSRFMKRFPIFPVPDHGQYIRQPLYVGDFVTIILSAVSKSCSQRIYNITGLEQLTYLSILREIKKATKARCILLSVPRSLFSLCLKTWCLFDRNPPFTPAQFVALTTDELFEVIDWPRLFNVTPTPFSVAVEKTFCHPQYSSIILDF